MAKTTVAMLEARVNKIEESVNKQTLMLERMMTMLTNSQVPQTRGSSKPSTKEEREAKREAEKAQFKATHTCIATSKQNKEKVYAEMKKQGITEFNRKDYERIAKGLGVLGKNGKVISTWVENK